MKKIISLLIVLSAFSSAHSSQKIDEDYLIIKSRSSKLRLGVTGSNYLLQFGNSMEKKNYRGVMGAFIDWNILKWKSLHPPLTEMYSRLSYRHFISEKDLFSNIIQDTMLATSTLALGIRYGYCMNLNSTLIRPYIQCHGEIMYLYENGKDDKKSSHYFSGGVVGGLGFEIAPFQNFGLFTEYNHGYAPIESMNSNLEGHQIWFGVSLRTK